MYNDRMHIIIRHIIVHVDLLNIDIQAKQK